MKKTTNILMQLSRIPTRWFILSILLLGSLVRFIFITSADIWHDEGYTMMLIKFNPAEIIERTARDVHPPLYYLTAHTWQLLFGNSELAIRSLSAIFGIATILISYLLVRRLFPEATARLAALFVALGPFLVRYSNEARMYGMAAFLVSLSTYLLVVISQQKKPTLKLWLLYTLTLTAGLYTHYYTIFIIPVHIIYLIWQSGGIRSVINNRNWWIANICVGLFFLPWLPSFIGQFTRVQSGFWIPPVSLDTLPNTLMQFIFYWSSYSYPAWVGYLLLAIFCIILVVTFKSLRDVDRSRVGLLATWLILPLIIVIIISLKRPIYYDRYFVYCAAALYLLLAVMVTHTNKIIRNSQIGLVFTSILITAFIIGIISVGASATHRMSKIGNEVSSNYQAGDIIVSAELYTFFDFSYYNRTDSPAHLYYRDRLDGYGETSLIYDKQDKIVINSLDKINAKRVWLVGKTGDKPYFNQEIPSTWQLLSKTEAGDSAVRLYSIK